MIIIELAYSFHLGSDKNKKNSSKASAKSNVSGTTSKSNNAIQNSNVIQNLILENREELSISGVLDVLSFDDQIVILETELGLLTVKGENLRINKLSLDTAEVIVDGEIYTLSYSEKNLENKKGGGTLGKIL